MDGAMDDFSPTPKKRKTGIIVVIIVLLLLAAGAYYFFNQQGQNDEDQISPTPFVAPTEEPTATPEATPSGTITPEAGTGTPRPTTGEVESATELNVQVLNGSGTVGAAGEARDHLTSQGYDNVDTGNADNFDYEGVTINIKSSRQDFLSDVEDALSDKYTISDTGTLSASSTYDVVVIVGK